MVGGFYSISQNGSMSSIQLLERAIAQTPFSLIAKVGVAVEAAAAAYPEWRRRPPEDHVQPQFELKQLLEQFSGNDSVLVPSLRYRDWEHIHP